MVFPSNLYTPLVHGCCSFQQLPYILSTVALYTILLVRCLTNRIVYKATVETNSTREPKVYIGSTETPFKHRYANHLMSFRYERYGNQTELSKYIWGLKRDGKTFRVRWDVLRRAPAYSCLSKRCDLCLTEKLTILTADRSTLLNKRSELVSKCRHQNKFYLSNFVGGVT